MRGRELSEENKRGSSQHRVVNVPLVAVWHILCRSIPPFRWFRSLTHEHGLARTNKSKASLTSLRVVILTGFPLLLPEGGIKKYFTPLEFNG